MAPICYAAQMSSAPIRIGRSRTGLGLFATEPIPRGRLVAEYSGPRIPTAEAEERERTHGARYMFRLDAQWTIDGSPRSNIARYANHACRPNAEAVSDGKRVFIHARRLIRPGEEITYDYGRDYVDLFFGKDGCRCATCEAARAVT